MKKFSLTTRASSRRTWQSNRLILFIGGVLVLVSMLVLIPIAFTTIAALVFTPIASVKTWLFSSSESFPQFFRDRSALIAEIESLETQLAGESGNQFTIDALKHENDDLRRLLGYEGEARILAGIIGRPNMLPHDVLMLDRGTKDGIKEGAPVFIGDNTIIGIVRTVDRDSSIVELISTPGFETTVFIIGPNIFTHAIGVGGGQLKVGVPQGIALNVDDLVVIPSVTSGVYGAITHIESEPSQPEQYGFVSTKLPISSMRLVSVGSTPVSPVSFEEALKVLEGQRQALLKVPVPQGVLVIASSTATSTATSSDRAVPDLNATATNATSARP